MNNECSIITSVESKRLHDMGFATGKSFKILYVAPFGDPIIVCLDGNLYAIRKKDLKSIKVKCEINEKGISQ
jgi:Fe2+ transport system protein FeoA